MIRDRNEEPVSSLNDLSRDIGAGEYFLKK